MRREPGKEMKVIMKAVLALIGVGVLLLMCGLVYGPWLERRYADWNEGIERDDDGVRVGCREYSVGQGDTALLLIHGFGDSPALYYKMAPALAEAGFSCRVMRLPGFAEPMPTYRTTSLQQWRQTVRDELAALREAHGSVWIVGHSTGVALGVECLLADPTSADGMVMLAPLFKVSGTRSPLLSPRGWFAVGNKLFRRTALLENPFPLATHDPEVADFPYRDRFIPMNVYRDLFTLMDALEGTEAQFAAPFLMVLAANDLVIDTPAARSFYQQAASDRKELLVLERTSHVIPFDSEWSNLVDQIHVFIEGAGR
jgi:esterase/lipase